MRLYAVYHVPDYHKLDGLMPSQRRMHSMKDLGGRHSDPFLSRPTMKMLCEHAIHSLEDNFLFRLLFELSIVIVKIFIIRIIIGNKNDLSYCTCML